MKPNWAGLWKKRCSEIWETSGGRVLYSAKLLSMSFPSTISQLSSDCTSKICCETMQSLRLSFWSTRKNETQITIQENESISSVSSASLAIIIRKSVLLIWNSLVYDVINLFLKANKSIYYNRSSPRGIQENVTIIYLQKKTAVNTLTPFVTKECVLN